MEGSHLLFNIVFFITLLSLIVQGMTIAKVARLLHLDLPQEKEGNEFGVELPDEIDTRLQDLTLTPDMLAGGNRLADMNIPKGTLVMLIKRGNEFLIPNGQMELHPGDKLLVMLENKNQQKPDFACGGIFVGSEIPALPKFRELLKKPASFLKTFRAFQEKNSGFEAKRFGVFQGTGKFPVHSLPDITNYLFATLCIKIFRNFEAQNKMYN